MSKMKFVFNAGKYILSSYKSGGRGIEFDFPPTTAGRIVIGSFGYPLTSGKLGTALTGEADGKYTPRLITEEQEYLLPQIEKRGNQIVFSGYSDEELCEKFEELRRLKRSHRELAEKYKTLESYVFGKGLF